MTASSQTSERRSPIGLPAWQALLMYHEEIKSIHLRQLFAEDPDRGTRLRFDD